jgi:hypothetical protein
MLTFCCRLPSGRDAFKHCCCQVKSNGFTTIANGLSIAAGGLSVVGGLGGATGLASSGGPVSVDNGKLSTTSTAAGTAGLDVYASHATFSGNVLLGKVSSGQTSGNALQLLEGTNVLLQVCLALRFLVFPKSKRWFQYRGVCVFHEPGAKQWFGHTVEWITSVSGWHDC